MMTSLINKIKNLSNVNTYSKHEQLVHGIIEAIDSGLLKVGDQLPSINQMVSELGFARKTIVKAYEELKDKGLVESKKLKGYYIISEETKVALRIALVLFSFKRFQQDFYDTFRNELGKRFQIDIFFHHNNTAVFETVWNNIRGKYGMYVVAPIPDPKVHSLLGQIAPEKLLIIDRFISMPKSYSYISQEFEESTYAKLLELLPLIQKYKEVILYLPETSDHPIGRVKAFQRFVSDYNIVGKTKERYKDGSVRKGKLYFFINDTYLWEVLRDCRNYEYVVGKDVGILSYNDHLVKEIVFGGITTISCDFKEMARKAADFVKNQKIIQEIVPLNLINRNSL